MTAPARYEALTRGLIAAVRSHDDLDGLALLGSASHSGASRRDEWSDHDFFAIAAPGRGAAAREGVVEWLPDVDRLVLLAREGGVGFVAVYDDAHVFEFAVAEPSELAGVMAGEASVVADDSGLTTALIAAGQTATDTADVFDAVNDTRLMLVKILLGVGRIRRGEVLNGGQFVRTWAVNHLVRAIRGRFPGADPQSRDRIDPTRRFEADHPAWGRAIADALDFPVEEAARRLFGLTRGILEPDWAAFPAAAADTVARRLGW